MVSLYADFLKEFYATCAPQVFLGYAKASSFMQQMMPHIDWRYYDGHNVQSNPKELQQQNAATVNGNLGATYKAFHEGNSAQAYAIGHEQVRTGAGKKENITSVFEQYPALCQQVEQAYRADQAKIEQARIAQQAHVQRGARIVTSHFKEGFNIASLSDRLQKRYDAAVYHVNNPEFFKKLLTLTAEQIVRIDQQYLTPDQKGILFEGGHLQHQLLDETISVVDTIISGDLVNNVQDAVVGLANRSIALNKHGDVVMTTRALDTCWALIEHAQNVAQSAYAGVLNNMHPIQRGIYHGAVDSISGVVHAVLHPITTAQQAAQSVATVGYCLGKLAYASCVYDAACDVLESNPKQYEEMIAQYSIHPDVLCAVYEHAKNNASLEDIARFGTKTIIDTMLLRDVTAIVSLFAKEHWAALIGCMRKGEGSAEVALTAENIPVKCGEEIASMVQKMENAAHKTGATAEVFAHSRKLVEDVVSNFMVEVKAEVEHLKKAFDCIQSCVPDCVKKGFAEFKNKHIKIPYEHIFGIELKWNDVKNTLSGISGFHHDLMGSIEKSGVFKFVRKGIEKNGCYLADVIVDGSRIRDKTFFPQSWSREKVINKIYEAYNNFNKSNLIPELRNDGKYIIKGFTNEGIEIEMFITKKGQVTTAYPIVQPGGF